MPIQVVQQASWRALPASRLCHHKPPQSLDAIDARQPQASQHVLSSRRAVGLTALIALTAPLCLPAQAQDGRIGIADVKKRLENCFVDGQYYVSGQLDRGIFDPGCQFTDPTIRVKGKDPTVHRRC